MRMIHSLVKFFLIVVSFQAASASCYLLSWCDHVSGVHSIFICFLDKSPSPIVSRKDTGLGDIDFGVIHAGCEEGSSKSKRSKYTKWSEEERYEIGKYASLNGPAATVRKFKPTLSCSQ